MFAYWFLKIYQDLKRFAATGTQNYFLFWFLDGQNNFMFQLLQIFSNLGNFSEINKQTFVIWWLNSRRYRSVWYLFSCTMCTRWFRDEELSRMHLHLQIQILNAFPEFLCFYFQVYLSLDRYLAVVYPVRSISWRTVCNACVLIFLTWLVILTSCSPILFLFREHEFDYNGVRRLKCT